MIVCLILIFWSQGLVSANHVEDWIPHAFSYQLAFPRQKLAEKTPNQEPPSELTSPAGHHTYTLKCSDYLKEEPKVEIFTKEGILLDVVILAPRDNPCDSKSLGSYILPQDSIEEGKLKIIYYWSSKSHKCVERTYTVSEMKLFGMVSKSSYPVVQCPASVVEFLSKLPDPKNAGGVLSLGPLSRTDWMDFTGNVLTQGKLYYQDFPTRDPENKSFKLICREDVLEVEDYETRRSTVLTGSIVHEDNEGVVLEKFELTKCSVDNINVNRQVLYSLNSNGQVIEKQNRYKVVFKTVTGECYERFYEVNNIDSLFYYDHVTIMHFWPKPVRCPKKFVGDIDLNAWYPWFLRLYRLFTGKVKPFAIEIRGL